MGEYFNNKYKTSTIRMNHWNYSWPAMYYVTICTKDRECYLGEVKNVEVYLSEIEKMVFECWLDIPNHFDDVKLDDWIIMPNHLHGIIVIEDNDFDMDGRDTTCHVDTEQNDFGHPQGRDTVYRVSTDRKFGGLSPKSLASIINTFKGATTRQCHKNNLNFQWQSNYYEHIIRNEEDYARIKEYIAQNPIKWENDKNNLKDLN